MNGVTEEDRSALAELVTELAAAQAEFLAVKKSRTANVTTRTGPSYSYRYASLDDILAATRPALAKHGIALTQDVTNEPGAVHLTTVLRRGTAELRFGPFTLPADGGAQAIGSALTYARRYQLAAALAIAAEEDDDGATASPTEDIRAEQKAATKASETQMKRLHALAAAKGVTHEQMRDWAGRHLGIETLTELTKVGAVEMEKSLKELPDVEPGERVAEGAGYDG